MLHDLTEGGGLSYMICLRGMMLHDLSEGDDAT